MFSHPAARRTITWAGAAPLLCTLHCLATPFLVIVVPSFSSNVRIESAMLAAVAVVSALALGAGMRVHGRLIVVLPALAGLTLWTLAIVVHRGGELATASASLLVAAGLFWNGRLRHRHACPDCGAPR